MNFQPQKSTLSKQYPLFFWAILLCIPSLACSLIDNAAQPSETPTSPISVAIQSNTLPIEDTQDLRPTSSDTLCTVNTAVLNLRSCAGTDCPVNAWLLQGESLTILQPGTSWIKVQTTSGKTGWVNSTFCGGQ